MSVIQQEKAAGEWCKANGYTLSRTFTDIAKSGLRMAGRDAFLEMVNSNREFAHNAAWGDRY